MGDSVKNDLLRKDFLAIARLIGLIVIAFIAINIYYEYPAIKNSKVVDKYCDMVTDVNSIKNIKDLASKDGVVIHYRELSDNPFYVISKRARRIGSYCHIYYKDNLVVEKSRFNAWN